MTDEPTPTIGPNVERRGATALIAGTGVFAIVSAGALALIATNDTAAAEPTTASQVVAVDNGEERLPAATPTDSTVPESTPPMLEMLTQFDQLAVCLGANSLIDTIFDADTLAELDTLLQEFEQHQAAAVDSEQVFITILDPNGETQLIELGDGSVEIKNVGDTAVIITTDGDAQVKTVGDVAAEIETALAPLLDSIDTAAVEEQLGQLEGTTEEQLRSCLG